MFVTSVRVASFRQKGDVFGVRRVGICYAGTGRVGLARSLQGNLLNGERKREPKETKELTQGDKFPACRCWQSKKFPMCDGSHATYNKETGDSVGPLVVTVKAGGAGS
ncbi:hypothetical protein CCYA_CCYA19G4627 [Cyanidiococcus yangmingshanensis]|nr:hypothetical protein CCYA_CCYA19G4627 [Cyanidiococcus yangmingshanensis]